MYFARFALVPAAFLALACTAARAEDVAPASAGASTPTKLSPFVEFASAGEPRSSKAREDEPARPRFEIKIGTPPPSNFAHMRRSASNPLMECVIPVLRRRDE